MRAIRVVAWIFAIGCRIPAPDFEGKQCPCPTGWYCDDITQTCTRSEQSAGLDADVDSYVEPLDAATPLGDFGVPTQLPGPVNVNGSDEHYASLTADRLQLFFGTPRTGGYTIWVAQRSMASMNFGIPQRVTELDRTGIEFHPEISANGLELFYNGSAPEYQLQRTTRASAMDMWNTGLAVPSMPTYRDGASLSPNGMRLYVAIAPTGGIEEYARGGLGQWTLVRTHQELAGMTSPTVSADGLEMFVVGNFVLYRAKRTSIDLPFESLDRVSFGPSIDNGLVDDPELDSTGRVLYLSINLGTGFDIYRATR
jgi:hypothetical protein